jgi:hypothetical protein
MSRRMRVLLTASTVLPLGLLVLSFEASARPSTLGGCFFPVPAVDSFDTEYSGAVTPSPDPKACMQQCQEFRRGCGAVIKDSGRCIQDVLRSFVAGSLRRCQALPDPVARQDCKDASKNDVSGFVNLLASDLSNAAQMCSDDTASCLAACTPP